MRNISKEELGAGWVYWLCAVVFLVMMGVGIWLIFANGGKDRGVGIACTLVGFGFGVGAIVWPLLRKREAQGVRTELLRTAEIYCEAVLFPASRVKYYVTLLGSLVLALGSIGLMLSADNMENRFKGGLASVFFCCVFGLCLWSAKHGRFGVLILPDGIIWREMFRAPYFVPWNVLSRSGLFRKKERNVAKPILTFGILASDPQLVQTTGWSRKKMISAQKQSGWHLYFFAETIAAPLPLLASAVDFYHKHPESRSELANGGGFKRVEQLESSLVDLPLPA